MGSKIVINANVTQLINKPGHLIVWIYPSFMEKYHIYLNKNNSNYTKINKILQQSYKEKNPINLIVKRYYLYNGFEVIDAYTNEISMSYTGCIKHMTECIIDNKSYTELYFEDQPKNIIFVASMEKKDLKKNMEGTNFNIKYKYYGNNYYNVSSIKNYYTNIKL